VSKVIGSNRAVRHIHVNTNAVSDVRVVARNSQVDGKLSLADPKYETENLNLRVVVPCIFKYSIKQLTS
jgi:hypothetical protein